MPRFILKERLVRFSGQFGCGRMRERCVKDDAKAFDLRKQENKGAIYGNGKCEGRADFQSRNEIWSDTLFLAISMESIVTEAAYTRVAV